MNTFRSAALAATAGVALMASSAHAATCYDQTVAAMGSFWPGGAASMTPAGVNAGIQKAGVSLLVQKVSPKVDESCRPHIANNANAYAGIGQPVEPVRAAPPPAPKPVVVAPPPAPAPSATPTAPAGGGAMIDAKITELERKLDAGGLDADTARQIRAEISSLRSEVSRLRSPTSVTRTVKVNQGPNPADKERWDGAAAQSKSNTSLLDKLFGYKGPDGKEVKGIVPGLQGNLDRVNEKLFGKDGKSDVIADHETRIAAGEAKLSSWWTPRWWWFIPLLLIVALVALIITAVGSRGLAEKTDLDTKADSTTTDALSKRIDGLDDKLAKLATVDYVDKAVDGVHGRIDRVAGDLQLDPESVAAMKAANVGEELEVKFTMDKEPYYKGFKVIKNGAKNFASADKIGDTPAGQDIGDVIGFVRTAHKARRYVLDAFKDT